jgi:hypothetical protein
VVDYARTARLGEDTFWGVLPREQWEVVTIAGKVDAYRQLVVRRRNAR